jgi:hypothetical protein
MIHGKKVSMRVVGHLSQQEEGQVGAYMLNKYMFTDVRDVALQTEPDVIPLQHLGTIDTDLSNVSAEELMSHSLTNLGSTLSQEGGYAVRHGRTPVSDFGRPIQGTSASVHHALNSVNLSADTFFWLYPYGEGGIEADRPVLVPMAVHVRCSIQEYSTVTDGEADRAGEADHLLSRHVDI